MVRFAQNRLSPCLRSPTTVGTSAIFALAFTFATSTMAAPPFQDQLLSENTAKVSDHV
jgi:hypothetical protein